MNKDVECVYRPEETSLCFLVLLSSFSWVSLSRRLWFGSRALGWAGRSRSLSRSFSCSWSSSVALETLSLSKPARRKDDLQSHWTGKQNASTYTNLEHFKERSNIQYTDILLQVWNGFSSHYIWRTQRNCLAPHLRYCGSCSSCGDSLAFCLWRRDWPELRLCIRVWSSWWRWMGRHSQADCSGNHGSPAALGHMTCSGMNSAS